MLGVDLTANFIAELLLFQNLDLSLSEDNAILIDFSFERLQTLVEVFQAVPQPDRANATGRDKHALFAKFIADPDPTPS